MTRKITTEAASVFEAVRQAIAELADCDEEKVDLTIDAPGLEPAHSGKTKLRLEVAEKTDQQQDSGRTPKARDDERQSTDSDGGDEDYEGPTPEELDEEADAAADFIENLLDLMDLPGDLKIRVDDEYAEVEVVDVGSGALIGRRGQTLEAIQELLRSALQREFQRRCRVKIDVEGYRVRRLEKLQEKAEEAIDKVLDTGEAERLEPMDVFERKAIHRLVAEVEGVTSRSQGREPGRRIVIETE